MQTEKENQLFSAPGGSKLLAQPQQELKLTLSQLSDTAVETRLHSVGK